MGAWIEIAKDCVLCARWSVAPLVGAWIEILKEIVTKSKEDVAPLVGAWIEIPGTTMVSHPPERRSPCGSVD